MGKKTQTKTEPARIARIEAMRLSKFASAGLLLHVEIEALGEVIGFASDKRAAAKAPKGMVVYLADELDMIDRADCDPVAFRAAHLLKKKTGGTIVKSVGKPTMEQIRNEPDVEVDAGNLAAAERLQGMVGG